MTALPAIPAQFTAVPHEMIERSQWVTWELVTRHEKKTKVPFSPVTGKPADTTDPATWGTFSHALDDLAWSHRAGIGFVLSADDPYFFIDLDSALDIDMPLPWAAAIMDTFGEGCYCERSPSGTGLHLIGHGVLPEGGNRKGSIEVYDRERFATITGNVYGGYATIGDDQTEALTAFHTELFRPVIEAGTPVQASAPPPPMTDDEVLHRALNAKNGDKLRRILAGDVADYDSASEADAAAAAMLKFWTQDAEQIKRILLTSGLQRPKWEEHRTYLDRTVSHAVTLPGPTYSAPSNIVDIRKHLGGDGSSGDDQAEELISGVRLSDMGNGQRLACRIAGKARWCRGAKSWFTFDGVRWSPDASESLHRWAKESVLSMYEIASVLPDKERTALLKHALKSESERSINAAVNLAKSEEGIPVLMEAFDQDRMILNVENGTIDLSDGTIRPHDPADMVTKLAPVVYDPDATCPRWVSFLNQIFEGDQERISFVQRLAGYSMTGMTNERVVVFLYGAGRNGKSTMLKTFSAILGDYAQRTPTETLMLKRHESGPANDVAILRGARLVTASETEEGRRLNVAKIKDLSGDEIVAARFLYGENFNFRPQFTIWISTNHKPIVPGNDRALFDRLRLVPFNYQTPEDKVDRGLEDVFLAEAPGILNWMLEGLREWREDGLGTPDTVTQATREYRTEMDQVGSFLADRCTVGTEFRATSNALYNAYKLWCDANGEKQQTANWFGRQLTECGFDRILDGPSRVRTWLGVGLLDDNNDDERNKSAQSGFVESFKYARAGRELSGNTAPMRSSAHCAQDDENGGWQ